MELLPYPSSDVIHSLMRVLSAIIATAICIKIVYSGYIVLSDDIRDLITASRSKKARTTPAARAFITIGGTWFS